MVSVELSAPILSCSTWVGPADAPEDQRSTGWPCVEGRQGCAARKTSNRIERMSIFRWILWTLDIELYGCSSYLCGF